jgi:hypothetical protein
LNDDVQNKSIDIKKISAFVDDIQKIIEEYSLK